MSSDRRKWLALALLCVVQFMVVLDIAIVNVALPSIQSDLGFSQENLQWVISAYALVFGGFLLLGGRAADMLGRRRIFLGGIVVFTVASLLAGPGLVGGVADRAPAPSRASARRSSRRPPCRSSPRRSARAASATSRSVPGVPSAASARWPAYSSAGVLTDALSWEWIFFVNVPVGVARVRPGAGAAARRAATPGSRGSTCPAPSW